MSHLNWTLINKVQLMALSETIDAINPYTPIYFARHNLQWFCDVRLTWIKI